MYSACWIYLLYIKGDMTVYDIIHMTIFREARGLSQASELIIRRNDTYCNYNFFEVIDVLDMICEY
jgi:hypothetical protein